MNPSTFNIYNASAGSGKTYTLVKEYLKVLIKSPYDDAYKNILAITFTNKAVGEMKSRIIDSLKAFSKPEILELSNDMFISICKELKLKPEFVQQKSVKILNSILSNYAAFDISTIDKFTQKIIRTFAHDLKIPLNFEVELDTDLLLQKAVSNLIARAGQDKGLTKTLVEFSIEKVDDNKSWDISNDFYTTSKLLIQENDIPYLELLKHKSIEDFDVFKNLLRDRIESITTNIISTANKALDLIEDSGLKFEDFNRKSLPSFFKSLADKNFNVKLDNKWQQDIETEKLYPKKVSSDTSQTIDLIQPELVENFNTVKSNLLELIFWKNVYKQLTPLSVLNLINKELNIIKEEENVLLISEFNSIISKEIKDQPAPFIYERIGEKFRHYFIDEFQDTSQMQWSNLIPLLSNSLSSEGGSALIVGDAKQAIYRWRGGRAEQFIDLFEGINPFRVDANTHRLPFNFRSYRSIVEFNNSFFKFLSDFTFRDSGFKTLYNISNQEVKHKEEGFVNITFIEKTDDKSTKDIYKEEVLKTINKCLQNGFQLNEICVLVRYKDDGIILSEHLNEHNIDIISSETLLVKNSLEVRFIVDVLKYFNEPEDELSKISVLSYLINQKLYIEDKHEFLNQFLGCSLKSTFTKLEDFNFKVNLDLFLTLPLYEAIEYLIYCFNLNESSNAYLQYFLDFALEFSAQSQVDFATFINYYELKKDKLSIVSSEDTNAVTIMTIHKSKGLEFPVVIVPFADLDIYREKDPMVWFPINAEKNNHFSFTQVRFNQNIESLNEIGFSIYNTKRAEQELDNINLLYVALTRAVEQLHIISLKDINSKREIKSNTFSSFFIHFLKQNAIWDNNLLSYDFGNPQKVSPNSIKKEGEILESLISIPKSYHNINIITSSGSLWDTSQKDAIEKGDLIHLILSKVNTKYDIDFAFNDLKQSGELTSEQEKLLKPIILSVVTHPKLIAYFDSSLKSYNEHDIISKNGEIIRPDKLVFLTDNNTVLIDYKTGEDKPDHIKQIQNYKAIIEEINIKVSKKILVYINDDIKVKEI